MGEGGGFVSPVRQGIRDATTADLVRVRDLLGELSRFSSVLGPHMAVDHVGVLLRDIGTELTRRPADGGVR